MCNFIAGELVHRFNLDYEHIQGVTSDIVVDVHFDTWLKKNLCYNFDEPDTLPFSGDTVAASKLFFTKLKALHEQPHNLMTTNVYFTMIESAIIESLQAFKDNPNIRLIRNECIMIYILKIMLHVLNLDEINMETEEQKVADDAVVAIRNPSGVKEVKIHSLLSDLEFRKKYSKMRESLINARSTALLCPLILPSDGKSTILSGLLFKEELKTSIDFATCFYVGYFENKANPYIVEPNFLLSCIIKLLNCSHYEIDRSDKGLGDLYKFCESIFSLSKGEQSSGDGGDSGGSSATTTRPILRSPGSTQVNYDDQENWELLKLYTEMYEQINGKKLDSKSLYIVDEGVDLRCDKSQLITLIKKMSKKIHGSLPEIEPESQQPKSFGSPSEGDIGGPLSSISVKLKPLADKLEPLLTEFSQYVGFTDLLVNYYTVKLNEQHVDITSYVNSIINIYSLILPIINLFTSAPVPTALVPTAPIPTAPAYSIDFLEERLESGWSGVENAHKILMKGWDICTLFVDDELEMIEDVAIPYRYNMWCEYVMSLEIEKHNYPPENISGTGEVNQLYNTVKSSRTNLLFTQSPFESYTKQEGQQIKFMYKDENWFVIKKGQSYQKSLLVWNPATNSWEEEDELLCFCNEMAVVYNTVQQATAAGEGVGIFNRSTYVKILQSKPVGDKFYHMISKYNEHIQFNTGVVINDNVWIVKPMNEAIDPKPTCLTKDVRSYGQEPDLKAVSIDQFSTLLLVDPRMVREHLLYIPSFRDGDNKEKISICEYLTNEHEKTDNVFYVPGNTAETENTLPLFRDKGTIDGLRTQMDKIREFKQEMCDPNIWGKLFSNMDTTMDSMETADFVSSVANAVAYKIVDYSQRHSNEKSFGILWYSLYKTIQDALVKNFKILIKIEVKDRKLIVDMDIEDLRSGFRKNFTNELQPTEYYLTNTNYHAVNRFINNLHSKTIYVCKSNTPEGNKLQLQYAKLHEELLLTDRGVLQSPSLHESNFPGYYAVASQENSCFLWSGKNKEYRPDSELTSAVCYVANTEPCIRLTYLKTSKSLGRHKRDDYKNIYELLYNLRVNSLCKRTTKISQIEITMTLSGNYMKMTPDEFSHLDSLTVRPEGILKKYIDKLHENGEDVDPDRLNRLQKEISGLLSQASNDSSAVQIPESQPRSEASGKSSITGCLFLEGVYESQISSGETEYQKFPFLSAILEPLPPHTGEVRINSSILGIELPIEALGLSEKKLMKYRATFLECGDTSLVIMKMDNEIEKNYVLTDKN
jgi:hypothetical protein